MKWTKAHGADMARDGKGRRIGPGAVLAAALAVQLLLAGCASTAGPGTRTAAAGARAASDPLEPFNRAVFGFNEALDDILLEPAARVYANVVPELFRVSIGNVYSNVGDLWTAANQLLQGKPRLAASDLARFTFNSTLGFAGVADIATEMGFEKHREDFGQTLGSWGVGAGAYLVLPILGPSSLRDGLGLQLDIATDPVYRIDRVGQRNNAATLRIIDTRAALLRAGRVLDEAALDKYSFVRDGYLQRRRNLVWDGDPPPEPGPQDEPADAKPPANEGNPK